MRAFLAMVSTSLRSYLRNRSAIFFGIVFPLILMGLIGLAFGRADTLRFTISVVDDGNPQLAIPLLAGLRQVPTLVIVQEDRPKALAKLRAGERELIVAIPRTGGVLEAVYDRSRPQTSATALTILEGFVAEANLRVSGVVPLLRLETSTVAGNRVKFLDFLLPGILAMTIAQTGLLTVSTVVAGMREGLILKRVMATPVPPLAFVGGLVGRFGVVQLLQVAIIFLVGTRLFGARVHGSLLDLLALALLGVLAFFAMGFAISTISRTSESAGLFGNVVYFPMMFLSGSFWPRDFMPEAIRPLIAYLPLSPLVDAMRGVAAYGQPLGLHLWAIGYLTVLAVVSFVLADRNFRWE